MVKPLVGRSVPSARKRDVQVRIVALLRAGTPLNQALKQVNRTRNTYYSWRLKELDFRDQCDRAVAAWREQNDRQLGREHARDKPLDLSEKIHGDDLEDFVAWRKRYLNFDTFPHLRRMLEAMWSAGPGSVTMILCPPEWMKSSLLEDYATWRLCLDPNHRMAMLSEGQEHARKMIGRIKRRFEEDGTAPDLVAHYGPFKDPTGKKPWNADFITVLSSTHDERDYSLETGGIKSTIRGARWDEIVLDDVQSHRSLSETKRFVSIFRDDIVTRPGEHGRIFIIGSRVGNGDFYEQMMEEEGLLDELVVIPAMDLDKPVGKQSNFPPQFHEDGTPVTDTRGHQIGWSDEALARRRVKVGEDIWAQVYMQQPKSAAGSMVTEEELLRACDRDRAIGETHGFEVICGLDPALARHAAFTVAEFDQSCLYVTDVVDLYQPRRNEVLFAEVERLTTKYRPTHWVIENNTLQSGFLVDDRFLEIQNRLGFRAVPHHTGAQKVDPLLGVPAMMGAIVRREIRFPGRGSLSPALTLLFDQLVKWRPDVPTRLLPQDAVMSLWFCYRVWRELRERMTANMSNWNRGGMQSPTGYAWAKTNLTDAQGNELAPRVNRPRSYEETWADLTSA